jgi:hypothetical protein
MSYRFADSLRAGSGCQQNCTTHTSAVCTVKPPDDGLRNCPKHVEFYSKNKFEKLVNLVGFIIRIYHDERGRFCFMTYLQKVENKQAAVIAML